MEYLAKYGFWESLHLFSGLTILSLALSVNARWPNTFTLQPDDEQTYESAKEILAEMARAGNLGSKGQLQMLGEVEALLKASNNVDNFALDLVHFWDTEGYFY